MSIQVKTLLKVSSVSSVQGRNGKENVKITFVEESARPPPMVAIPQNVPKEIGSMVFQVQKGLKQVLPQGLTRLQKIVLVFTPQELDAFKMKPYPNQIYDITIGEGNLQFKEVSP